MRALVFAAALAAGLSPMAAAAQQRIMPSLSTTMQRTCQGEVRSRVLHDVTGQRPTGEQVAPDTRAFRATRTSAGYAFRQSATTQAGDTILSANVANDGAVSNAELSGSAFQAALAQSQTPIDVPALANSLAREIPERFMVNRSFAVGDEYYPPELRRTLISEMTAAMGMPFPITGEINMPFQGESTRDGRRVWTWEGTLTMNGGGVVQGANFAITSLSRVRVIHDAETGLVLSYQTSQTVDLQANGQPFLAQESSDNYNCQLVPQ